MSFYTFAAGSLTTAADRKRRPAVDAGQVLRTFVLFLSLAALLALMMHEQNRAVAHPVGTSQQADIDR